MGMNTRDKVLALLLGALTYWRVVEYCEQDTTQRVLDTYMSRAVAFTAEYIYESRLSCQAWGW